MPLRVVFIEQESQLGGVEMTTLAAAAGLDARRFTPVVICPGPGDLPRRLREAGVPVETIPRPRLYSVSVELGRWKVPNPLALLATAAGVWRAGTRLVPLLRGRADVVVTKGLLAHLYGGLAAARARVPCVWHVQEVAAAPYLGLLNAAARRWARAIVVDAPAVGAQFARDLHAAGRIHLVYNGVDTSRLSPAGPRAKLPLPDGGDGTLVVGQVGRIVPLKGQHVLIEAFARLEAAQASVHLVFVGSPLFGSDRYLRRLHELVRAHALGDRVHFLGFHHNIPELLRAIDVFVHPSVEADSPVSVLEAMAAGRAVIASRVPGTEELLADGVEGCLVPPGDPAALSHALKRLLAEPAERARLGRAARTAAEQRYDQHAFVRRLESILSAAAAS